jgi:hypothetical protein
VNDTTFSKSCVTPVKQRGITFISIREWQNYSDHASMRGIGIYDIPENEKITIGQISNQNNRKQRTMFKRLSSAENLAILDFPVYTTLLAANGDGILDEAERASAIKFAHTKTFSGGPVLADFHREAGVVFSDHLTRINASLPEDRDDRESAIKYELLQLELTMLKLSQRHITAIHHSMKSFKAHISKSHHSVVVDFLFPIPIPGLTE